MKKETDRPNLSILTPLQRQAYVQRTQGNTYKEIGERMGLSANAVSRLVHQALRRFREYEAYCRWKEQTASSVDFPVTGGEMELLVDGLRELQKTMLRTVSQRNRADWLGRLPYSYQLLGELLTRAEQTLAQYQAAEKEPFCDPVENSRQSPREFTETEEIKQAQRLVAQMRKKSRSQ